MTMLKSVPFKIKHFANIQQRRCMCKKEIKEKTVRKYVYISQSSDIYTNLALEDWIYTKIDFTDQEILMLWKNTPCVVIGRHQNPWLEAHVEKLENITSDRVKLARRNSGGGTVYHDEGNLNLTFFTSRDKYNRKHNLEIIKRALFREYNLKVEISKREDLVIRDFKISGTASKLGRLNSYHHCTLLVDCNKNHIHQSLMKTIENIDTRATKSIRSPILNLKEENPKVKTDSILKAVGFEFLQSQASPNPKETDVKINIADNGFHLVNPSELWFPGINSIRDKLAEHKWIFGMCPEFSIIRNIEVLYQNQLKKIDLKVYFENGKIRDITLHYPDDLEKTLCLEMQIFSDFKDQEYSSQIINDIVSVASNLLNKVLKKHESQVSNV